MDMHSALEMLGTGLRSDMKRSSFHPSQIQSPQQTEQSQYGAPDIKHDTLQALMVNIF